MAWSLWICLRRAGPVAEDRQGGDQGWQADRKTDGRWGGGGNLGGLRGGNVPSRRVSPCTLLSYKGGYHSRWPQGRRGEKRDFFFPPFVGWHAVALVGPIWAMGGRKGKGGARCHWLPVRRPYLVDLVGPEQRESVGWTTGKTERGGCVLQTALNGRPKAGANRGEDGVGNSGKGQIFTPDGPKWTAQSVGGGGGVRMGWRGDKGSVIQRTARSVRGSGWGGERGGDGVKNHHSRAGAIGGGEG